MRPTFVTTFALYITYTSNILQVQVSIRSTFCSIIQFLTRFIFWIHFSIYWYHDKKSNFWLNNLVGESLVTNWCFLLTELFASNTPAGHRGSLKLEIPNFFSLRHRTLEVGRRRQNTWHRTQDTEHKLQDTEPPWNWKFLTFSLKQRTHDAGHRSQGIGHRTKTQDTGQRIRTQKLVNF